MVILGSNDYKKQTLSKQLSVTLENFCLNCNNIFNETDSVPHILFPCQHTFCGGCVETKILNGWKNGDCPECSKLVAAQNIKKSKMSLMVVKIIEQCNKVQQQNGKNMEEKKFQMANKLFKIGDGYFYSCPRCKQPYDRNHRLPLIVCQNEHLLCQRCVKKSERFRWCQKCQSQIFKEFVEKPLILKANQFIHSKLFSQKVKFVVNQKQFSLTTHPQTTIKDLFHILQEYQLLSPQLQINLCKFYIEAPEKTEIKFRQQIGKNIKKVFLQFDEQAKIGGSRLTLPSKIVQELPIKISNFKPNSGFEFQEEDVFGQVVKVQTSQYYVKRQQEVQSKKLERPPSNPTTNMHKSKTMQESKLQQLSGELSSIKIKKNSLIGQRQLPSAYLYPNLSQNEKISELYPSISVSKLNLIQKSKVLQKMHQNDKDKKYNQQQKQAQIARDDQNPLGTQIINQYIQIVNTQLSLKAKSDILKIFLDRHQVREEDQKFLCYAVEKEMNRPLTEEEVQISKKMEKQILKKAEKGDPLSLIMILLKKELEDGQIKVLFKANSTVRSQLTLKTITSHVLSDRFIIKQNILEDGDYFFQKMQQSFQEFKGFINKQLKRYSNSFGFNQSNIVIHNLIKRDKYVQLVFSTNQGYILSKYLRNNVDKDISVHPYFTHLELSPVDFDQKGQIKFDLTKKDIEFRGKWPYYQPIRSIRYGIKVQGKFDKGNNKWLQMKNAVGQWAVGFHGLRNPNQAYKHYSNIILSILSGMHQTKKSKLTVVQNLKQAYSSNSCVNKQGELVGDGVYLTPMFVQALPYTTAQKIGDKEYHLVFQCRLRPEQIRIPKEKQTYWVVRHSEAIRPYGIVLIQSSQVRTYPSAKQQFGQEFSYQRYF